MKENAYQARLIKPIKSELPGAEVMKLDANYKQGIPDLLILFKDRWAILECKQSASASHQPNQDYYVDHLNGMSFSRFIFPENEEEVLNDLKSAFGVGG